MYHLCEGSTPKRPAVSRTLTRCSLTVAVTVTVSHQPTNERSFIRRSFVVCRRSSSFVVVRCRRSSSSFVVVRCRRCRGIFAVVVIVDRRRRRRRRRRWWWWWW